VAGGPRVVLLCGMLGIRKIGPREYFSGLRPLLERMGCEVVMPRSPWGQTIARRARAIAGQLRDIPGPLHLIAHSMGGLDARCYITHLGGADKTASLVTLATPHRGSAAAEFVLQSPCSPWRHLPAVRDLTREAMAAFNERTPDCPDVACRAWPAARPVADQPWLVRRFGRVIAREEGANDSQVSVVSARWGEAMPVLEADHFELIGMNLRWPCRRRRAFDHLSLYRDIARWIIARERGQAPPDHEIKEPPCSSP